MKNKGFTLIELLVVISIIGVLTALVTANLASLQTRGRDSQRKASLETLRTALEKYYGDKNTYPAGCAGGSGGGSCNSNPADNVIAMNPTGEVDFTSDTGVAYLNTVPKDPKNATPYLFKYCRRNPASGSTISTQYKLFANLENNRDSDRFCKSGGADWNSTTCDNDLGSFTCWPSGTNISDYDYMVREP